MSLREPHFEVVKLQAVKFPPSSATSYINIHNLEFRIFIIGVRMNILHPQRTEKMQIICKNINMYV